ncbi:MAG: phospho-N-acetylmuramoyl-pentapeptide-transferase [Clostridia bacterium]|nr:phospho-N-acetylmuramoyl-pentapeptide-transferase [Clostridia bacterium]
MQKGLNLHIKYYGLLFISVAFALYLMKFRPGTDTLIPGIKQMVSMPILIYIPFIIFVMLAATNAVNLTDGIDGLGASVSMIIIACFSVIAIKYEVYEIATLGFLICGACLGFLIFNLHPAKIFMGDTGSLLLGGAIVVMALYLKMPIVLIIAAIIPVFETISVILQVLYFKKTGNRIFKMTPVHHHFELSGWKEGKIVSVFSVITLIFCVLAIYLV